MTIKLKYILEFYITLGVPLIYLAGLYFATLTGSLVVPQALRLMSLLGVAAGIIIWILSYLTLSSSFGVLPRTQVRVKRGVYRHFRHPMYLGIILTYLCLSIANQSKAGVIFTLIILLPLLVLRAFFENKLLTDE